MNLQSLGLVSAAVAPAVFLLGTVALKPHYPYWAKPWLLIWSLLGGVAAAGVALSLETLVTLRPWNITNLGGLALFTLIGVGLVEEGAKLGILATLLWKQVGFTEAYDGILLATGIGLGFGSVENIVYVLDGGYELAWARAFTAVPLHGLLGVVLGFYVGQAQIQQPRPWGLWGYGLSAVAFFHGCYDFLAFQQNPVAISLLWGGLLVLALWSWRLVGRSRSWSPSWGGNTPSFGDFLFVPPRLVRRTPWIAGILGLVPGLGQWYNREYPKAAYLALAAVLHVFFFGGLLWLLADPQTALMALLGWGLLLGPAPDDLIRALQQSPVLIVAGTMMASLSILGAMDAYGVARTNRFDYLQAPALRVRWMESLALAYGGHLVAAILLVFIPILGGGGQRGVGQGTPPIEFELVSEPMTLLGHEPRQAGNPQGQDPKNQTVRPAIKAPALGPGVGNRAKPQPESQEQIAKGVPHSYSDYISGVLRREQDQYDIYFSRLLPGEYTVVTYQVSSTGEIYDVRVLWEHTKAPPQVAQLAVEEILRINPLLPPPTQGRELTVTELFWRYEQVGPAGSLEDQLSRLADGRRIEVNE